MSKKWLLGGVAGAALAGAAVVAYGQGFQLLTTPMTGLELFSSLSNTVSAAATANTIAAQSSRTAEQQYAADTSAVGLTLPASEVTPTGNSHMVVLRMTGNPAATTTLTLPTVAAVYAAMKSPQPGQTWVLRIINDANSAGWTVTTNTGWTLAGTQTIVTGTWRDLLVTVTSATAMTEQNIAGGTVI